MKKFKMKYFLTVILVLVTYGEAITVKVTIDYNKRLVSNGNTTDVYQQTILACAWLCFHTKTCCSSSFCKETSTCRFDVSEHCCVETEYNGKWNSMRNILYSPPTCNECLSFGKSLYKFVYEPEDWQNAVNKCRCLGGYLAELETSVEIEYIRQTAMNKDTTTGALFYWLGGYNFNRDGDMEWISNPTKPMLATNWAPGEPNNVTFERCLAMFKYAYSFTWVDYECDQVTPYICEFPQN